MEPGSPTVDETLAATPRLALGETRVPPDAARWRTWNRTAPVRVLTFPRRPFVVLPARGEPAVLHAGTAVASRAGRPYRRRALDPAGERTDWLWVEPELLARVRRDGGGWDPDVTWHRPLPGPVLLSQRELSARARAGASELELEERALELLWALFGAPPHDAAAAGPRNRDAVRRVLERLAAEPGGEYPLDTLAEAAGLSPSHLCVVFRRVTGGTLRAAASRVRLAHALDRLQGARPAAGGLTALALAAGFSSHSHFSARFRAHFGCTPGEARRRLAGAARFESG